MNVNGMIKKLGGKSYNVTRANGDGEYSQVTGVYTGGTTQVIPVLASKQPLTPEDLESIPEGDRTRERFRLFTALPLLTIDTSRSRQADLVDVNGVTFQVETSTHWDAYSKNIVVRKNTDVN